MQSTKRILVLMYLVCNHHFGALYTSGIPMKKTTMHLIVKMPEVRFAYSCQSMYIYFIVMTVSLRAMIETNDGTVSNQILGVQI